jgi:nitrogen fixation protein FixH
MPTPERYEESAELHEAAERRHRQAAAHWSGRGDVERAALELRNAEIERLAAELERDRAELERRHPLGEPGDI